MIVPNQPSLGEWGWFALVSYLPDPPRSQLEQIRRAVPDEVKPPLHITVLPPRPLSCPIEEACQEVTASISKAYAPFSVQLSDVAWFEETDVLYIGIAEGSDILYEIHTRLNAGILNHVEQFEFRPHVTLGGPVAKNELGEARNKLQGEWQMTDTREAIWVQEFVCLWMRPDRGAAPKWTQYHSFSISHVPSHVAAQTANRTC